MVKSKRQSGIFRKGKAQYFMGLVKGEGIGNLKEYIEVQDSESKKTHTVSLENTSKGLLFSCDCHKQSLPNQSNLEQGKQAICSHFITTCLYKCSKITLK